MATDTVSPLRQRMIEDMNSRKLCAHTQRGHIHSCKRFAAFLKRSPDTATLEDIRRFQLHLAETDVSICNRNRIMTGLRFLFRVTLRRLDLAEEVYHIREPQKLPAVMSVDEIKRLLAVAASLKTRVLLSLGYGCGLRASEIVRLKVKHIDRAQNIIRIEQSKGRKDRNVMLSPEVLSLLRQWWKVRPSRYDAGNPVQERWLFPSRKNPGKPMTTRQLSRHIVADGDSRLRRIGAKRRMPVLARELWLLIHSELRKLDRICHPEVPKERHRLECRDRAVKTRNMAGRAGAAVHRLHCALLRKRESAGCASSTADLGFYCSRTRPASDQAALCCYGD